MVKVLPALPEHVTNMFESRMNSSIGFRYKLQPSPELRV